MSPTPKDPVADLRDAARAQERSAFEAWIRKQYDGEVTWERGDDFPSLAPLPRYSGHRDDDEVREDRDERSLWEEWSAWTARAALSATNAAPAGPSGEVERARAAFYEAAEALACVRHEVGVQVADAPLTPFQRTRLIAAEERFTEAHVSLLAAERAERGGKGAT